MRQHHECVKCGTTFSFEKGPQTHPNEYLVYCPCCGPDGVVTETRRTKQ